MFVFKRHFRGLEREVSGIRFSNPVGLSRPAELPRIHLFSTPGVGFLTLEPEQKDILQWIHRLPEIRTETGALLAVNLKKNIERTFSLVYDFADLIIVDLDSNEGIGSSDLSDIPLILEELLNLRLCYERYTPVFLRLPAVLDTDEMHSVLSYCMLSGINGIVAEGLGTVNTVLEKTMKRIPLIGTAQSAEEGQAMLAAGVSLAELKTRPAEAGKLLRILEKEAKQS